MDLKSELNVEKTLAEFIGTFALVFVGCGAIMVHELHEIPNAHLNVSFCFGLAVAVMIYACGHISGLISTPPSPWPLPPPKDSLGAKCRFTCLPKLLARSSPPQCSSKYLARSQTWAPVHRVFLQRIHF